MNKISKLICAILVVAMALALAACGSSKVNLQILDTEYALEDYAIAVSKENTELLGNINAALKELEANGTKKAIVDKYISGVEHSLKFQENVAADAPTLTMATNAAFPPYEYYEGGKIVGY